MCNNDGTLCTRRHLAAGRSLLVDNGAHRTTGRLRKGGARGPPTSASQRSIISSHWLRRLDSGVSVLTGSAFARSPRPAPISAAWRGGRGSLAGVARRLPGTAQAERTAVPGNRCGVPWGVSAARQRKLVQRSWPHSEGLSSHHRVQATDTAPVGLTEFAGSPGARPGWTSKWRWACVPTALPVRPT